MELLLWVLLGGIAGWVASIITGNNESQGMLGNIVVGIVGAFIGGFILRLFGGGTPSGFNLASLLTAVLGAVILLTIMKGFRRSEV